MGEAKSGPKTLDFDGSLRLVFKGAMVTTDGGLLVCGSLTKYWA